MANKSNSYQRQHSKNSNEDRKHHVGYRASQHTQDRVTSREIHSLGAVENNALLVGKVEHKEGQAVEEEEHSSQQGREQSNQKPTKRIEIVKINKGRGGGDDESM